MEENFSSLSEKIYCILTSRRFRVGSSPSETSKKLILQKIGACVSKEQPVQLLQFWGGCKNPNLPVDSSELCEEATLDNLYKLHLEVRHIYPPGLKVFISPGDSRVNRVNFIPKEKTEKYVKSLIKILRQSKFDNIFEMVPLSKLYTKYSAEFEKKLKEIKKRISGNIESHLEFKKLVLNARKNIFLEDLKSEKDTDKRSSDAARDYIVYRVAEEEAKIFREFEDGIRSFFIRYTPFYNHYIKNIDNTIPNLDCSLVFFTGKKGNITQPWQAIGRKKEGEVVFLSQEKIKKFERAV